jgi:hypothetical protein
LTHEIMVALNTSFITPFDREDIAFLAGRLDDVVDDIEAAGDLTVLYRIDDLPAEAQQQAALLDEAAQITAAAMPRLKTLQKLEDYWISINEVENRAGLPHAAGRAVRSRRRRADPDQDQRDCRSAGECRGRLRAGSHRRAVDCRQRELRWNSPRS